MEFESCETPQVSVDSCPVNCIYRVDREELPVLEFLIQPQPKEGYGVFGGGWEKRKNVFEAAKYFNKQLEQNASNEHQHGNGKNNWKQRFYLSFVGL